nr:immunoglobulin heavy chain junction region [Mus musculus]
CARLGGLRRGEYYFDYW